MIPLPPASNKRFVDNNVKLNALFPPGELYKRKGIGES